jgi:endogenous inhibitor of DNA gyrase (YacG/DUF329 family)
MGEGFKKDYRLEDRSCVVCGKTYKARIFRHVKNKYCSPECAYKSLGHESGVSKTANCKRCNKEFTYVKKTNLRKFCSTKCNELMTKEKNATEFLCGWCGTRFFAYVAKGYTRVFCSYECHKASDAESRKIEKSKPSLQVITKQ